MWKKTWCAIEYIQAKGGEDVRYKHIALDGKLTLDRLRLKFAIDLDDLLRDMGVLGIGKWDTNGAWTESIIRDCDINQ